jgi:hypothetical protein
VAEQPAKNKTAAQSMAKEMSFMFTSGRLSRW